MSSGTTVQGRRAGTAERILDVAEALIQSRGFNGFSYQDIADALAIRKASIHYHFAGKAELGHAVMLRYRERMEQAMAAAGAELPADVPGNAAKLLELYFSPYLQFAATPEKICLCGALAGEYPALPGDMQMEVNRFIADHQSWLRDLAVAGTSSGDFAPDGSADDLGRSIFNALQGGLMMARATGDERQLATVIQSVRQMLGARAD
jgi:TetR/AcrR family transcriptional repressor of nem operon